MLCNVKVELLVSCICTSAIDIMSIAMKHEKTLRLEHKKFVNGGCSIDRKRDCKKE